MKSCHQGGIYYIPEAFRTAEHSRNRQNKGDLYKF